MAPVPLPQFGFRYDAHGDIISPVREQLSQNSRILFQCVDASIGVEKILHLSASRSSALPCGGLVKSSGTPAKDSTYPSGHSSAGSTTTALPSRCTSTLSVLKRNYLGGRIAWLLPVQNTFARVVFMTPPRKIHTSDISSLPPVKCLAATVGGVDTSHTQRC